MSTAFDPALPKAVIFDLDATLTVGKHDFAAMATRMGLDPGQPILETLERKAAPERARLAKELAQWEWDIADQTEAAPGAKPLLQALVSRGCLLAILTRNLRDIALHTLEAAGLAEFFAPSLVLGRDCAAPKPSPAGIELIRERWGQDPAPTAMVGDYLFDLQAGRAAGCFTVQIGQNAHPEWSEWTDLFVPDLAALTAAWRL